MSNNPVQSGLCCEFSRFMRGESTMKAFAGALTSAIRTGYIPLGFLQDTFGFNVDGGKEVNSRSVAKAVGDMSQGQRQEMVKAVAKASGAPKF